METSTNNLNLFPMTSLVKNKKKCQVCGDLASGMHFGAVACRACAAFFRRADSSKKIKPCEFHNACTTSENSLKFTKCKKCRLQKCYDSGMSSANFQFHRDLIGAKVFVKNVVTSMEQFIGRPHMVLCCDPEIVHLEKDVIECAGIIEKALKLFSMGFETPIASKNRLMKLAIGLQNVDHDHTDKIKVMTKMGKDEVLSFFEKDFLKAAKWFTYLDEFRELESNEQQLLIIAMWHTWTRLHKLAISAIGRRRGFCDQNSVMVSHQKEYAVCDLDKVEVDMSWASSYSNEQMRYFIDTSRENFVYQLTDTMVELKPNDVELSYMMCQLCLQYAGQRFQGKVLEFSESVLQKLGDDLHNYYTKQLRNPNYAGRLQKLMFINNKIRDSVRKSRQRQEIAETFNVYNVEFSHPEIYKDA